jgi:hypothetical protein
MNDLLKKHLSKAVKTADASLLVHKKAVDALLTEMARPGVGTIYDRDYQTQHENPFEDSRFDAVPVLEEPKEASDPNARMLQTESVAGHVRHYPPKEKKLMSETTEEEIGKDNDEDWIHHHSSLTTKVHAYDFESDRNRKIANRVAANRYFKQFVSAENVKTNDDILMVNIPRGKVAQAEFGPSAMVRMEQELSSTLNVRAKYAHVVLNAGFDGVSFEFMLV